MTGGGAPGPLVNLNSEIYYPPYLFDASGARAARPSIISAPDTVMPGDHMSIGYSGAASISKVSFIKTGSTTHSVNMDQRYIQLPFTANGALLDAQLPTRAPAIFRPATTCCSCSMETACRRTLASCASVSQSLRHRRRTTRRTFGGTGGSSAFTLSCQANEVLVGVARVNCNLRQPGRASVRARGPERSLDRLASRARHHRHRRHRGLFKMCPANTAISGFRGRFSTYVNQLDFECVWR